MVDAILFSFSRFFIFRRFIGKRCKSIPRSWFLSTDLGFSMSILGFQNQDLGSKNQDLGRKTRISEGFYYVFVILLGF